MKFSVVASLVAAAAAGVQALPAVNQAAVDNQAIASQKAAMASLVDVANAQAEAARAEQYEQVKSLNRLAGIVDKDGGVAVVTEVVTVTGSNNPQGVAVVTEPQQPEQQQSEQPQPTPQQPAPEQKQPDSSDSSSSGGSSSSDNSSSGGSGGEFSGDGTYYSPGLGSCGDTHGDSDLIAAINAPQYGTNANPNQAAVCGRCALVKGPLGQVKVKIVDRCPVCKSGDLDLSPAAFDRIGKQEVGRIGISWSFVAC
ncbi:hypothetical protein H4R18_005523 [Coemansia javaensis]|uniref:RlpA-like protein double-psi beta-barrel domain-containing protein n=1 Tax=Coemansia javaensis TaxID=2761396 RepID=A0A9W8H8U8_9FUNG|nr:hypothetical protein H4R18_005523 [Coemansia javaensis]